MEFLGHVLYDEMPAIYRSGDVLLLPSQVEGLPQTVLETFASGMPVVSSHLEQTAPIVQEGGETVQVGGISGYAATIRRVLYDGGKLGGQGRQTVIDEFRWQETVEQTTAALASLR